MSNHHIEIIKNELEEQGIRYEIIEEDIESENEGFIKIPEFAKESINALMRDLPGMVTDHINAHGTYKVYFDKGLGVLQKSAKHPGYNNGIVVKSGTNNEITGVARLKATSPLPGIINSAFSALAIVTGQYFLSKIDTTLDKMASGVNEIANFLKDEKKSELEASEKHLQYVIDNYSDIMGNDIQRTSVVTNLGRIKIEAEKIALLYNKKIKEDEEKDVILTEKADHIFWYHSANLIYCRAAFLEILVSGNMSEQYVSNVENDIIEHLDQSQEYGELLQGKLYRMIKKRKKENTVFGRLKKIDYDGVIVFRKSARKKEPSLEDLQACRSLADGLFKKENSSLYMLMIPKSIKQYETIYNERTEIMMRNDEIYLKVK